MRLDGILLHPALLYSMLAVSLSLCLFLFVSLKRDLWRVEKRWKSKVEVLEASLLSEELALDERWNEISQASSLLVPPTAPRSGLNMTKRSQALQMLRRGAATQEIAATLALP